MSVEKKGPEYIIVDGFRIPWAFDPQAVRDIMNYKAQDDDVFLVTYPKCGTTWMQYLTFLIFRDAKETDDVIELNRHFPFVDMQGIDSVQNMIRPGVIKTHMTYDLLPKSTKAKYICVVRNPKDCCVSFYHHCVKHPAYNFANGSFDDFFEVFMKGEVDNGDYFEHFLPYYEHRDDPNMFFISYEEMKQKPKESVYRLACFLGDQYKAKMDADPSLVDTILRLSSIDAMKDSMKPMSMMYKKPGFDRNLLPSGLRYMIKKLEEREKEEGGAKNKEEFTLVRRGVAGGWRDTFTEEQNRRLDAKIEEKLGGTEIFRFWKDGGFI